MPIFLQTSSTGVPSSACFSAKAISCSVNLLLFTAWLLFYGGIMPEFLLLYGTIYWGRVTASLWDSLGRLETLFDVLHLFPHLLDQHLHLHRDACSLGVGGGRGVRGRGVGGGGGAGGGREGGGG